SRSPLYRADDDDRQGAPQFDRILVDLGISSDQLDAAERGFSFAKEGALDMRMNPGTLLTADEIVNKWPAGRLLAVLREGGVGAGASAFVREIVKKRPVRSTLELAEICRKASVAQRRRAGKTGPVKKQHPATVVFQALRIAVNQELQSLSSFLAQVLAVLAPGGRLAMISFHSLEDQLVARAMPAWSQPPVEVRNLPQSGLLSVPGELLTKKAVVPQAAEVAANVRARSARMRVFERFGAVCPVEGV
ncbi:MAG TPA: 16S rRNA (cytosine(1402)-N(4))-methyltransferase RsmH, partial [Oligoflexia bacterium]|nr:16S rRNA (cytosine(1402)-N(4))-methyltransferase RsmH [Oligoflexia bacterium]